MNNHYITTLQNGIVTNIFSDAFQTPTATDILFCEDGTRILPPHLMSFRDEHGLYKYRWDGANLIEDAVNLQLDEVKAQKIKELDNACARHIEGAYPLPKQINIAERRINTATNQPYTDQDQADMNLLIDSSREKLQSLSQNVNEATTLDQIKGVTW
jgi:hypothetical protein